MYSQSDLIVLSARIPYRSRTVEVSHRFLSSYDSSYGVSSVRRDLNFETAGLLYSNDAGLLFLKKIIT